MFRLLDWKMTHSDKLSTYTAETITPTYVKMNLLPTSQSCDSNSTNLSKRQLSNFHVEDC